MGIFKSNKCQFIGVGPVIQVPDVSSAVSFYCDQLGFDRDFVVGEPPDHGSVTRGRVGIQFTLPSKQFSLTDYPGWIYLFVENIDALANEYSQRGVTFTQQLGTRDHGMREFEITDLNALRLRFGQYV